MSFTKSLTNTFLTKGLISFLGLFTGIIKARWLGVEGVGMLAVLQLVLSMSFRILNFGLGSSLAYFGAKGEIGMKLSLKLIIKAAIVLSLLAIVLLLFVKNVPPSPWVEVSWLHYYLILTCVPLFFLQNYMQRSLTAKLLIKEINFSDTLATITNLAALLVFVILFNLKIIGAIYAVMSSLVISDIYLYGLFRKQNKLEKAIQQVSTPFNKMIAYGFWNYLLMVVNYIIEQLPLFLLKNLSEGFFAVGLYSKAKSLEQKARLVTNPVSQLIFPYTAASTSENSIKRTNQLTRVTLVLITLVIGGFSIVIKDVIGIMYGSDFIPAAKVFYATTIGIVLWPIGQFHAVHIAASGDAKKIFLHNLYILLPSVPIMYFLVKYYGIIGAGWCFSLIQILNFIIRLRIYLTSTKSSFAEIFIPRKTDVELVLKILSGFYIKFRNIIKK